MEMRVCKTCGEEKEMFLFRSTKKNNNIYYSHSCKECDKVNQKIRSAKHYNNNKEKYLERQNKYYQDNKEQCNRKNKEWAEKNKESLSKYKKKYRESHKKQYNENIKDRKKNDICFKLRHDISTHILYYFKKNNSKKTLSCVFGLAYSIEELKTHIENQFESWMTWENRGKYYAYKWDDNDPNIWTWQLDHIIPCSDLPYTSMEDDNFKKCWALENLRPLSSKQNLLDGINRIRHKRKNK